MDRKTLLSEIKEIAESVRIQEKKLEKTRMERAKILLEGQKQGLTYQEMAELADVSVQTIQADLKAAKSINYQ